MGGERKYGVRPLPWEEKELGAYVETVTQSGLRSQRIVWVQCRRIGITSHGATLRAARSSLSDAVKAQYRCLAYRLRLAWHGLARDCMLWVSA